MGFMERPVVTTLENGGKYCGMDRYECRKAWVKDLTEAGYLVIVFERHKPAVDAAFQNGADDRSRPLGTKGYASLALVEEGIHFLLNDVGGAADAPLEKLGVLENGGLDFF